MTGRSAGTASSLPPAEGRCRLRHPRSTHPNVGTSSCYACKAAGSHPAAHLPAPEPAPTVNLPPHPPTPPPADVGHAVHARLSSAGRHRDQRGDRRPHRAAAGAEFRHPERGKLGVVPAAPTPTPLARAAPPRQCCICARRRAWLRSPDPCHALWPRKLPRFRTIPHPTWQSPPRPACRPLPPAVPLQHV